MSHRAGSEKVGETIEEYGNSVRGRVRSLGHKKTADEAQDNFVTPGTAMVGGGSGPHS